MKELLDSRQAKALDQYTIETFGMQSLILMERAAYEVAACIMGLGQKGRRVFLMVGTGNNGADGLAAARILSQAGYSAELLVVGNRERATDEWRYQMELIRKMGLFVQDWQESSAIPAGCDVYVDALFGIGLTRELKGGFRTAVERFMEAARKEKESRIVAVDICSGVSAASGAVLGAAVSADITVTFGYGKMGQYLFPGAAYSGEIRIADIGFAAQGLDSLKPLVHVLEKKDAAELLGSRDPAGNKGTFGRVLVIAGAFGMAGAACFAAEAAYRMGAGLVTVATATQNRQILQMRLPEAVLLEEGKEELLLQAMSRSKAVVIGPGLSQSDRAKELLELVLAHHGKVPVVIDADGLNLLAKMGRRELGSRVILTPHPGELSRLLSCTAEELTQMGLIEASLRLWERYRAVCVCKDARTVIRTFGGELFLNVTGNDGMATGGSGDVLAGMIGGLLAQGILADEAAVLGAYLHGSAGDEAALAVGHYSMLTEDLLRAIPEAIHRLSDKAD